jgi:capsid protein
MSNWWPFSWVGFGSNAFADTIDGSIDRANLRFLIPPDSRLYINRRTRKELNNHAEWVWQNFGIVKEGVGGIARHVIGKGISLQIDSDDSKGNEAAEQDFEQYALTPDRCDLAGRRNFYEAQTTAVEQRMIRGEFFSALTENPEWDSEPCFQIYDSEEVGNPIPIPTADGRLVIDGIELDKNSRETGCYVRGIDGQYSRIDRSRMIHWYKPHAVNQTRGISDFAQAVNPLVDVHELKRFAMRNAKAQQIAALMLKGISKNRRKGAFGAIDNVGKQTDGTRDPNSAQTEQLVGVGGGGIIYIDDPTGDAKLITSNSPSPLVEPFITDLYMRDVCAGWGVPSEFFWNMAKMNGGNTRFILARADLFFQILGERLIDRFCTPVAFRYISHRIETRKLKALSDPNWAQKMSWQMPPRVTVDNGRENQILIELLGNGLITMREYCNARGLNYKSVMRQWVREPIEFLRIAEEEGAPPEMLAMWKSNPPMWRASKPGAIQAPGQDPAANQQVTAVDENGDPVKAAA